MIERRIGPAVYLRASIGHLLIAGDLTVLWLWRTRMAVMVAVLGWGVSVLDARHEDAPFPAGTADRPGFWVGPFFVQGIRAERPAPSLIVAAVIALIILTAYWGGAA